MPLLKLNPLSVHGVGVRGRGVKMPLLKLNPLSAHGVGVRGGLGLGLGLN